MKEERSLYQGIVFMGLMVAAMNTITRSMDNIVVHNFIEAKDSLTAAFAYLTVGGWTGVIIALLLAYMFGKKLIDPSFTGINFSNPVMHKHAFFSGSLGALSALFYLWGHQFGDPGTLVALSSTAMVYTAMYDVAKKQAKASQIALPIVLAVVGGSLAAYRGTFLVSATGIVLVMFISNPISALSEIAGKNGSRAGDGVSLFFWRFFWLAATGTILAISISTARGYSHMLGNSVLDALNFTPFIMLLMVFGFFAGSLKETLKKTNPISVILLISSAQIVLAFPITILGDQIHSGLFGTIPTSLVVWGVRLVGAVVLILGIILLRRKDPRLG